MYDPSHHDGQGPYEALETFYADEAEETRLLRPSGHQVPGAGREHAPPPRPGVGRALLTGIAMGLREVFDPEPKERTVVEQEAPGEPTEPQRLELHLDPMDPCESFAVYRPWLEDGAHPTRGAGPGLA